MFDIWVLIEIQDEDKPWSGLEVISHIIEYKWWRIYLYISDWLGILWFMERNNIVKFDDGIEKYHKRGLKNKDN